MFRPQFVRNTAQAVAGLKRASFPSRASASAIDAASTTNNYVTGARNYVTRMSQGPFSWQDPLKLSEALSEEEIAISELVRQYCQEQLLPRVLRRQPIYIVPLFIF